MAGGVGEPGVQERGGVLKGGLGWAADPSSVGQLLKGKARPLKCASHRVDGLPEIGRAHV